jgi:hypothetical protein
MSSFDDPSEMSSEARGGHAVRDYTLLFLVLLAIGGIAIMDFTESWGFVYWIAMVPVFGALSVFMDWYAQQHAIEPRPLRIRAQLLHWMTTVVGVALVFLLDDAGSIDRTATGLVALLVLGISTVLAGIHTEWRLSVLGVLLLATLAAAVAAEQFFWLLLIPTVIAIVIIMRRTRA